MPIEILTLLLGLVIGIIAYLILRSNTISKQEYDSIFTSYNEYKNSSILLQERNLKLNEEFKQLQNKIEAKIQENATLGAEKASLQSALEIIKNQAQQMLKEVQEQKILNQQQSDEILKLHRGLSSSTEAYKSLQHRLETQKSEIEDFRKQSNIEFQNIANKIIEEKSQKFTQSNKENIDALLKPLGENIDSFKKKVEETYDKESKQRFSLEEKVKDLIELNHKISNEANNLASALKGQSKKQGNWGEIILESILEKSGLVKNREYFLQETITNDEGKQLRPDVIIHLPEDRKIVIDSKVSLVDYDRYCSEDIKDIQEIHLKKHIASIYQHVDDLSRKKYDSVASSLDFTMMFIPIEPAYLIAIQDDAELWSYAYNKRVLLISPTNLIAALKLISDLWKRESQSRNAIEIAKQGEKLYEKIIGFLETMEEVGRHLNRSQDSYLKAVNQLKDGRGNIVVQAQKLKKLGLNSDKEVPSTLLPFGDDDQEVEEIVKDMES
ncbi:MAG: DNA recombination protein RmuC [Saprospiraceae bacterium]|nr:DNA recombination protein RmuC [Saprospiraceae bacterium]